MTSETTSSPGSVLVVHPGAELYGSDRVTMDSAVQLHQHGWQVTVALPDTGPLSHLLEERGVAVVLCPTPVLRKSVLSLTGVPRFLRDCALSLGGMLRLLRTVRPDVVYVSTITIPLWLLLARVTRRSVVCHLHEAEAEMPPALRALLASQLLLADKVLANSRFSLDTVTASLARLRNRSEVLANPVPAPAEVRAARAVIDDGLSLLYVGRFSPRKGPHLLVEAVAELVDGGEQVELNMIGSTFTGYEWYEEELREKIRDARLEGRVHMLGFRSDVWPVLGEADVAVVPSVSAEPFGNTAVEAVLAARPVIVSQSGGLPEAVEGLDCAITVPVGSASAIAAAVRRIRRDWDTFRAEAQLCSAVVAERHAPRRYGNRLSDILRDLAQ